MAKYPYLVRSGTRGLLKFRRVVPPHLRSLIGKSEILFSFGTSDLAEALPFYHYVAAETAEQFDKVDDVADWERERREVEAGGGYTPINGLGVGHLDLDAQCDKYIERCRHNERAFRIATTKRVGQDSAGFWRGEIIELAMTEAAFYNLPQYARFRSARDGSGFLLALSYNHRLEQRRQVLRAMLATSCASGSRPDLLCTDKRVASQERCEW